MGRKRKREKTEAEIDVGAFADIAFLLIIFFILTTSIVRSTGRELELPQAQTPENKKVDEKTPTVNLLVDQILYGEDEDTMEEITLDGLRATLLSRNLREAEEAERMVVLEVGEEVNYDRYFKMVSMISDVGGIIAIVEEVDE